MTPFAIEFSDANAQLRERALVDCRPLGLQTTVVLGDTIRHFREDR